MQNSIRPGTDEKASANDSETMMANLRKDVIDWNKGQHSNEGISSVTIPAPPARKRPARVPKLPVAAPQVVPTGDGKKQPFRMSYDGISAAEYAASRRKLGAR